MQKVIDVFKTFTLKCRPVWTITWRDAAAPSVRSGVPEVREEDTYFNKQNAYNYIEHVGRKNIVQKLQWVEKYVQQKERKELDMIFKVKTSTWTHRVRTSEYVSMNYFLACVWPIVRHQHHLKYKL